MVLIIASFMVVARWQDWCGTNCVAHQRQGIVLEMLKKHLLDQTHYIIYKK